MPLPRRTRHGLVAASALIALALAGCGGSGDDTTTAGTSPSSSSTASTTTRGSGTSSPSSSSSDDSSASATTNEPDPEVSVTPDTDPTQSSAERAAGIAAADAKDPATSLSIPSVGLSTTIEGQGLRGGKVNPAAGQVIWFTGYDRVRPGATGTTVIAGHVVSGGQADSFAALEQLAKGDGVVLTYPGGATLRFEVTSTDIVDKDELTTSAQVWGANDDTRRVVLVTCDDELGFRKDGHRTANFVAVAELPS
ncbi:class F sortase [Janibacter limosus]|jgi:LPXTG-site transpeptidase (sortase) family protein|uniref:class F sortase n=1 Tax=Janibacter limosus TaxID=53458 RepID=UPI00082E5A58|nr:class F sortase [Janibacter limosus]